MRAYQQFSCQWSTVDCEVDQWGEWGDCSVTCGDGFKNRSREVLQQSSGSFSFFINHHKKQWINNKQQVEGCFATAQWKWSFLSKYLGNRPLQSWKLYRFFSVLYLFWVLGSVLLNVNTSSDTSFKFCSPNIALVQDPGTVNASRTGSHVCWGNTWASRTGTHRATASGVAKNWTTVTCSPGSSLGRSASAGMSHLLTTPWWTRASVIGSVRGTTNSFAEHCGGWTSMRQVMNLYL